MDIIRKLAKNVIETKYESLPKESIETAKCCILDTLAVLIGGASECDREVSLVKEWGGKEESTIFVYGGRTPAVNAAWVNSIMAQALDFDDVIQGALHVSASTVPTALAVSEVRKRVNGKEFIAAITSGADLAIRIHLASKNQGFHTTGTIVVFAAAAIAGKLLGFGWEEMLNALGIAFIRAAGSHQVATDKVLALRLIQGDVSRSGIEAALLAQKGITGVRNVLQGTYGFFHLFSRDEGNLAILTDQLGKRYENIRTLIKKYPSCGSTQTATEAALRLATEADLKPKEISQVTVEISEFVYNIVGQPFQIGDNARVEAQYSLPYTIANALIRRSSKLEHFKEEYIRDPEIIALTQRVHPVIVTKEWDTSARVVITMKDGREHSKKIIREEAFLLSPFDMEEVKNKFRNCVAFAPKGLRKESAERIVEMVEKFEDIQDVSELIQLMAQHKG